MVLDHFEDSWPFPSPGLRVRVLSPELGNAESGSNFIDNRLGESQQVIFARSGPEQWLLAGDPVRSCHVIIPVLGYRVKRRNSSNILVNKHLCDLLPKSAGNFEGQTQVGVKSALFNGVDGLARHAHLGGQLCLRPFPLRAQYTQTSSE